MNRKTDMTEEEYQELVRNIEEHSQYQMKPSLPKKWMTVTEMGDLLGITEAVAYDLIKREKIDTVKVDYWNRIPKEVFWNWYNNQSCEL